MISFEVKKWEVADTDHCWIEHIPIGFYENHTTCKQCGSKMSEMIRLETTDGVHGLALGSCFQCGHIQRTRAIGSDTLARHFLDRWLDSRVKRNFIARPEVFEALHTWLPGAGKVLEIGCGCGANLKAFAESGYDVFGVDPSRSEIEIGRKEGISNLEIDTAEGYLAKTTESFDVIFLFNVTQFLTDPFSVLRRCIELLNDGGILYSSNGDFWSINVASTAHLGIIQNYPTLPCLLRWAEREGLAILDQAAKPVSVLMRKEAVRTSPRLPEIPTWDDWKYKVKTDLIRKWTWPFGAKSITLHKGRKLYLGRPVCDQLGRPDIRFVYNDELPAVLLK